MRTATTIRHRRSRTAAGRPAGRLARPRPRAASAQDPPSRRRPPPSRARAAPAGAAPPPAAPAVVDPSAPPPIDVPPPALRVGHAPQRAGQPEVGRPGRHLLPLQADRRERACEDPERRVFDTLGNTFSLAYAKLALQMDADPVGLRVDFGYGQVGAIINDSSKLGSDPVAGPGPLRERLHRAAGLRHRPVRHRHPRRRQVQHHRGRRGDRVQPQLAVLALAAVRRHPRPAHGPAPHPQAERHAQPAGQPGQRRRQQQRPRQQRLEDGGPVAGAGPPAATLLALTGYLGKEGPQTDQGDLQLLLDLVVGHSFGETRGPQPQRRLLQERQRLLDGGGGHGPLRPDRAALPRAAGRVRLLPGRGLRRASPRTSTCSRPR